MYIGIDMGTSSIKATLIDEKGKVIATSKVESEVLNPQEGFFELDAKKTWWGGIKQALSQIAKANDLQDIRSICVSSMCGTFVPVDSDLNPVHHAILYGIDTRAVKQIEKLNKKYGKSYLAEHIGGLFNTHSIIPKVLWLKENKPEIYRKTAFFVESNNYVSSKLTGNLAWDYPTAAGTKLLDLQTMDLPNTILDDFDIDKEKFPTFNWPMDIVGRVTNKAFEETG
ncbi:MAG: FGGY family carbohydrate kinase, partial [Thermotogota bacterium]